MPSGLPSFPLLSFPYCHGEIHISDRIAPRDARATCTRGGSGLMNGEVGRGVYMCASVLMTRATRNHRSEAGRPLPSLSLDGRDRGDAAR